MKLLESYHFPGNVRELRNIVENACVFCEGNIIQPRDLSLPPSKLNVKEITPTYPHNTQPVYRPDDLPTYRTAFQKFELNYFVSILKQTDWNISRAAELAGLTREWLGKKIKKLGLKK